MTYRGVTGRASSKSPVGVENRGRGTKLSINTNLQLNGKLNGDASAFRPVTSATHYLRYGSTPDSGPPGPVIVSSDNHANTANGTTKPIPTPIGVPNGISPTRARIYFTTDVVPGKFLGSHCVKIQINTDKYDDVFREMDMAFDWHRALRAFCPMPESDGKRLTVYALFDNVRRAANAAANVNLVDTTADVEYVTQPEFAGARQEYVMKKSQEGAGPMPSAGPVPSFYDGQVIFYARLTGHATACKSDGLEGQIHGLAQRYGEVLALGEMDAKDGMARFRVEFCSIKAAKKAVKEITAAQQTELGGWSVHAEELHDPANGSDKGTGVAGRDTPFGSADGDSSAYVSPTGRTQWIFNKSTGEPMSAGYNGSVGRSPVNGDPVAIHPFHQQPPTQLFFGNHQHPGGRREGPTTMHPYTPTHHMYMTGQQHVGPFRETYGRGREFGDTSQAVDAETIRQGLDVRTTIMLRNLPNQMTCHILKSILDASNFGEYDFSYVRIDYKKGASVGYGFVNFINPEAIIKFLHKYAGRPWMPELPNRRGAARLAEVSYATVQGYDCCIEKFRNSSVMTEFVDYRPKLWFTKTSAPSEDAIGEEAQFPPVNNESKHQRSLANATQIGLFPPQSRRGQGAMHRPGRSQYDRGTTAQQQEDMQFYMNQQMQQLQLTQAGHFAPNGNQMFAPGHMSYPMPQMPQQQIRFGNVIGVDPYGNPVFGNQGAPMPPAPYYPQQAIMPPVSPQYLNGNGNGFGGHPGTVIHRGPAQVPYGSNRDNAVPRTVLNRYYTDDNPKAVYGDVDVGTAVNYNNPMAKQEKHDGE